MGFKLENKNIEFLNSYSFDDLNFLKSDEILSEINDIRISNVILEQNINFEKDIAFKNLKKMELNSCTLQNIDIIEQIKNKIKNNNLKVFSYNTKLKVKLCDNKYNFAIEYSKNELTKENTIFDCKELFDFKIEIDIENIYYWIKNIIFKNIEIIKFSNADINNLDFLTNNTLVNLRQLYLDHNNIDNISIFDDDKIHFHELKTLDLEYNPIKNGLDVLKKNFFQKCYKVELSLSLDQLKVKVKYDTPDYSLDIFVNNLNEIANFFDKDKVNFGYVISKEVSKIKEIYGFTDEELHKKIKTYNFYYPSSSRNTETTKQRPGTEDSNNDNNPLYESYWVNNYDNKYDDDYKPPIIIDNGTGYCKAGFSGEEGPRAVIPTCVGYPKYAVNTSGTKNNVAFGSEAEKCFKIGVSRIKYPIENGCIKNWDEMEMIWGHIFTYELHVDIVEHNLMITEFSDFKEDRGKIAQIMFETFNVLGLYITIPSPLSLMSVGRFTGFSVDSGDGFTSLVPIFECYPLKYAISKLNITGRDQTELMIKLLNENGYRFQTSPEKKIAKHIKEKACYVALDYEDESHKVEPFEYELPDGNFITIKDERYKCPESLFKPSMIFKEDCGIDEGINNSIQKCDIDIRKELYNTIVLSGGNTMYKGLPERLTKEVKKYAPESLKKAVRVIVPPEPKIATWVGGSILSSINTFQNNWITKDEYEESGRSIVYRKCF